MAFDRHMNIVLGDCEEFRKLPPKKGEDEEVRGALAGLCRQAGPIEEATVPEHHNTTIRGIAAPRALLS